jgi:hypothetical protein
LARCRQFQVSRKSTLTSVAAATWMASERAAGGSEPLCRIASARFSTSVVIGRVGRSCTGRLSDCVQPRQLEHQAQSVGGSDPEVKLPTRGILGHAKHHLMLYLQARNPTVPGVVNKLSTPTEGQLDAAHGFWKFARAEIGGSHSSLLTPGAGRSQRRTRPTR